MAGAAQPRFDVFGYSTLKDLRSKVEFEIKSGQKDKNFAVIAQALLGAGELSDGVTFKHSGYQAKMIPWLAALVDGDFDKFEQQLTLLKIIYEIEKLNPEQVDRITQEVATIASAFPKNDAAKIAKMGLILQLMGLSWEGAGNLSTHEIILSINHMMTQCYNLDAIMTGNNSFRESD